MGLRSILRLAVILSAAFLAPMDAVRGADPAPEIAALRTMIAERRFDEAEAGARARLAVVDPSGNGESLPIAETLDVLVAARLKSARPADAAIRAAAERAVIVREALLKVGAAGPETGGESGLAASLNALCILRTQVSEYAAARQACDRSLALRRGLDPPDPGAVAESANSTAVLLRRMGEFDASLPLFREVLAIREEVFGPDSIETAQSLNSLGNLFAETGRYAEAQGAFERCLRIRETLLKPDDRLIGTTLNNLATATWQRGDLVAARPLMERALDVRRRSLPADHPDIANAEVNLAGLLSDLGDFSEARRLYESALAAQERTLGPEDAEVAATLHNLSTILVETGESAEARRALERAVAIRVKVLKPDHPDLANTRILLANQLRDAGDLDGARRLYLEALAVLDGPRTSEPRDRAAALADYGVFLSRTGDQRGAQEALQRALEIREGFAGRLDFTVVDFLLRLAQVERAAGEPRPAFDRALDASARMRDNLLATVRFLPERQALRYEEVRGRGIDLAFDIHAGLGAAADPGDVSLLWDAVIRSRALVLDEMARRHAVVLESGDPEVAALARDLDAARGDLAYRILRVAGGSGSEKDAEALRRLASAKERLEQELGRRSDRFLREQDDRRSGLAEVAGRLRPADALVAFVHYRDAKGGVQSVAFALPGPSRTPVLVPLGTAAAIDAAIAAWRERVSAPPEDEPAMLRYVQAAEKVRGSVWDPVAGRVGRPKRVFVVPEGAIQSLSLATLPSGKERYLLESGPLFHYLSAERDLVQLGEVAAGAAGLLAVGGPDFNEDVGTAIAAAPRRGGGSGTGDAGRPCPDLPSAFAPLPNAAKEIEEVARLWRGGATADRGQVETLAGTTASEKAFREAVRGRRIVHLATHAFVADARCGPDQAAGNPLLLSGLALAGANRRGPGAPETGRDDGLLTAEEIASLDLRGVEWVVLSACETGIGPVQSGEGVLGLRRTFQVAGAATLILTLWSVDDVAARQWIGDLYAERMKGKDTAAALRAASLRRLAALRAAHIYDHPFAWGAFVAVGDPR